MNLLKLLLAILRCQTGDVESGAEGAGQGAEGAAEGAQEGAEGGDAGASQQEGQEEAEEGQAGADAQGAGAAPKYGEYGDDADKVYQALQQMKGKTTATERNMAALRKQLQNLGVVVNEDGTLGLADNAQQRKIRFTDNHKKLFDTPVLEAIQAMIQDALDGGFDNYNKQATMQRQFSTQKNQANSKMVRLFPSILQYDDDGEKNTDFNEALYNRATEIWESNPSYKKNPSGELFATMEAAIELGISPIAIQKAKKEGYNKGIEGKKVLGPVGGQKKGVPGVFKKLSVAEFRALPPDKKDEYQQQWASQQKT